MLGAPLLGSLHFKAHYHIPRLVAFATHAIDLAR